MAEKYSAGQMIEAIEAEAGVLAAAARRLGCSRTTVHRFVNEYPTVRAAYEAANESTTDEAERGLIGFMRGEMDGMTTRERLDAIKFFLRTKGKNRGYSERQEITGKDGAAIQLEWPE